MEQQLDSLYELLSELKPREIRAFNGLYHQLLLESYRWELRGAAYILGEGMCSDDSFDYFRSWLISMGREVYERALQDPDSLVEIAGQPGIEDIYFEEFAYVAAEVYTEKTGKDIPDPEVFFPPVPAGEEWLEEPGELSKLYPRLWAKYGWA